MHFVEYEKLSKKNKRIVDRNKRGSWNGVNPATKVVQSKKLYNRGKEKRTWTVQM